MSTDFLTVGYDQTLATPTADAGPLYATIQWSHNPAGWLLPCDRAEEFGVTLPWAKRRVTLGSNTVEAYFSPVAEVAILALVKRWFTTDENGKATYLDHYTEGARSKTHALVILKDAPDDLFVLSCKGATSADFHGAQGKLQAAMKRSGATRPLYFFWLKLSAGELVRLSKGATVAPLMMDIPGKADDVVAWLAQRFVGAEFVAEVEVRYAEDIKEFTKPRERSDAEASNGHDTQQPEPLPATGPAPTTATLGAPWSDEFNAMTSATASRDVALALAKNWTHETAVKWAVSLGAFTNEAEAKTDYSWLWNDTKAKNGGRIAQLAEWWPVWIEAVLSTTDSSVADDPQF